MLQIPLRRWWAPCVWLVGSLWPCILCAAEPRPAVEPSAAGSAESPSSVYARHLARSVSSAGPAAPEAAAEIAPILTPDLDYAPPPEWPPVENERGAATIDPQVVVASHNAPAPPAEPLRIEDDRRRLAPSLRGRQHTLAAEHSPLKSIPGVPGREIGALVTTVGATSAVAGLILLSMYFLRRRLPGGTAVLSDDVVCVLGRKQLTARQSAQLIRVGNKLVLLSVTSEGTEPLTEVTDPVEVDRLVGLCLQSSDQSATREFQDVMNQLSREYPSAEMLRSKGGEQRREGDSYLAHLGGLGNG